MARSRSSRQRSTCCPCSSPRGRTRRAAIAGSARPGAQLRPPGRPYTGVQRVLLPDSDERWRDRPRAAQLRHRPAREVLERAHSNMAPGDARQHGAGKKALPDYFFARQNRSKRPCGRNAERGHGFADNVFSQHWTKRRPPIPIPRERRAARAFQLYVTAHPVPVDNFAEKDGAAVPELRHEMPELVAGIRERDGLGTVRNELTGEDLNPVWAGEPVGIEAKVHSELRIETN